MEIYAINYKQYFCTNCNLIYSGWDYIEAESKDDAEEKFYNKHRNSNDYTIVRCDIYTEKEKHMLLFK